MKKFEICENIDNFAIKKKPIVLAFGMFDGLHLGHQKVIKKAQQIAQKINGKTFVLTFKTHPKTFISNSTKTRILTTNDEKIFLLKKFGLDGIIFLDFDKKTKNLEPKAFLQNVLKNKTNFSALVVGEDFHFGKNRRGNVLTLKNLAKTLNFKFFIVKNKIRNKKKISSTEIKNLILRGEIEKANKLLGYNYFVQNKVVKGDELARTFGFPTANLDPLHLENKVLPTGVFVGLSELKNQIFDSVISVGYKKTLKKDNEKLCVESHLLGFDKNIYNQNLDVSFIKKIRDQKKFKDLAELVEQIKKDVKIAKNIFRKLREKK